MNVLLSPSKHFSYSTMAVLFSFPQPFSVAPSTLPRCPKDQLRKLSPTVPRASFRPLFPLCYFFSRGAPFSWTVSTLYADGPLPSAADFSIVTPPRNIPRPLWPLFIRSFFYRHRGEDFFFRFDTSHLLASPRSRVAMRSLLETNVPLVRFRSRLLHVRPDICFFLVSFSCLWHVESGSVTVRRPRFFFYFTSPPPTFHTKKKRRDPAPSRRDFFPHPCQAFPCRRSPSLSRDLFMNFLVPLFFAIVFFFP